MDNLQSRLVDGHQFVDWEANTSLEPDVLGDSLADYDESDFRNQFRDLISKKKEQTFYMSVLEDYLKSKDDSKGGSRLYDTISTCSNVVAVGRSSSGKIGYKFYRCHNKLCPICQIMRSKREERFLHDIIYRIRREYYFLHIVITVPNVSADLLKSTSAAMSKAYTSFVSFFLNRDHNCQGVWGSFECTYNIKRDDFHPHFHLLCAFPLSYKNLSHDDKLYIDYYRDLLPAVKKYFHNDKIEIGYIKSVSFKGSKFKAHEFVKYSVKPFTKEQAKQIAGNEDLRRKFYYNAIFATDIMSCFSQRRVSGIFRTMSSIVKAEAKAEFRKYSFCEIGRFHWYENKGDYLFFPTNKTLSPTIDRLKINIKNQKLLNQMRC